MASGIAVTDEVVSTFNAIKMGHKHKYAIFRINPECTEVFDFTVSILHSALYFSEF